MSGKNTYYQKNKDKVRAKQKLYRTANREKLLVSRRASTERNRDHILQLKREYYRKNRDSSLASVKAWHKKNPGYVRSHLLSKYGLTQEDYSILLDRQLNKCAICPTEYSENKKLHVDHCHTTGKVRGLLCSNCNIGIGNFMDSDSLLRRAMDYLRAA